MKETILYQTIGQKANEVAETLQMHLPVEIALPIANAGVTLDQLFAN